MSNDITARRLTPSFGAELTGLDTGHLDDDGLRQLRAAVVEHGVVVARRQTLDDDGQLALAQRLGTVSGHPILRVAGQERFLEFIEDTPDNPPKADRWHSDITWVPNPPMFAVLSIVVVPEVGGDTLWADTEGAFAALSPTFQDLVRPLRVHHTQDDRSYANCERVYGPEVARRYIEEYGAGVEHPLVRRNADTGREALFLGGYWMRTVVGMAQEESDLLLGYLMRLATEPERVVRWSWAEGDVVIWDERRTMHRALGDHYPRHRKARRCVVDGEIPVPALA